ncbi:Methionine aminopeptidase [Rhabdochlamydiaceae symbiont of Dictyostelium giganteum]
MIERNSMCWCGKNAKWKKCHYPLMPASDAKAVAQEYKKKYGILVKTPEQIKGIRKACIFAANVLKELCDAAQEGVTTNAINELAEKRCKEAGAISACLGYGSPPFPKSICTSLNEVICHGIPNDTPLQKGDIINIDFACKVNGFCADCSAMVMIGQVNEEKQRVVDVSYECLRRAIAIVKPGVFVSEIGRVIEEYARSQNCSVVDQFVAHGVGLELHEEPQIPHHFNDIDIPLVEGMTFTIEPMINAGVRSGFFDKKDKWTVRTSDLKPSAQWEHTLVVTKDGVEILTLPSVS